MTDRNFSLTDFVSSRQDPNKPTLRGVMDRHVEDIEVVEHDTSRNQAVKIDENLYLWERKEDLPEELPRATYVVIDVIYFSTTAIEILHQGARELKLRESHDELRELGKQKPEIRIGGEAGKDFKPREGLEFINSPSFVDELEIDGHMVGMTSDNGAVATMKVKKAQPDADVYLGSTTNAMAIGRELRDKQGDVHLVCAGSRGELRAEDHIGAFLIAKHLAATITSEERDKASELLEKMDRHLYEDVPEVRKRDIKRYVADINKRDIVPKLEEDGDGYRFTV